MPGRTRLPPLLFSVLLASCASGTLYNVPTTLQMDGWTITVVHLQDGPSTWIEPPRVVRGTRARLLHLKLTLRNDATVERRFPYAACDLDAGDKVYVPTLMMVGLWSVVPDPRGETYRPGEQISRELIYPYPDGAFPTRIRCVDAVWAMARR